MAFDLEDCSLESRRIQAFLTFLKLTHFVRWHRRLGLGLSTEQVKIQVANFPCLPLGFGTASRSILKVPSVNAIRDFFLISQMQSEVLHSALIWGSNFHKGNPLGQFALLSVAQKMRHDQLIGSLLRMVIGILLVLGLIHGMGQQLFTLQVALLITKKYQKDSQTANLQSESITPPYILKNKQKRPSRVRRTSQP